MAYAGGCVPASERGWVCNLDHYKQKWSRLSVKAKNRLKRLQRRIKAFEDMLKERKGNTGGFRKPGSLKR